MNVEIIYYFCCLEKASGKGCAFSHALAPIRDLQPPWKHAKIGTPFGQHEENKISLKRKYPSLYGHKPPDFQTVNSASIELTAFSSVNNVREHSNVRSLMVIDSLQTTQEMKCHGPGVWWWSSQGAVNFLERSPAGDVPMGIDTSLSSERLKF